MKFKIYELQNAPEKSRDILERGKSAYGMVPNLWAVMAESPALLKAYTTIYDIFQKETILDAKEQQIVVLAVSQKNECPYCVAAHSAISKMVGIDENTIKKVRENSSVENLKYEALRAFTRSIVENNGSPSEDNINAFIEAGYSKRHLLEVILGVGIKTLSNYTNHITKTPIDKSFKS